MDRVLVIDDDVQVRKMLEEMLSRARFAVTTVGDGQSGLDALDRQDFGCVIVDMIMPHMDGLEIIRRIAQDHPGTQVIALTGGGPFHRYDLLEKAVSLGAADALRKPLDYEELITVVGRVFGREDDGEILSA